MALGNSNGEDSSEFKECGEELSDLEESGESDQLCFFPLDYLLLSFFLSLSFVGCCIICFSFPLAYTCIFFCLILTSKQYFASCSLASLLAIIPTRPKLSIIIIIIFLKKIITFWPFYIL